MYVAWFFCVVYVYLVIMYVCMYIFSSFYVRIYLIYIYYVCALSA